MKKNLKCSFSGGFLLVLAFALGLQAQPFNMPLPLGISPAKINSINSGMQVKSIQRISCIFDSVDFNRINRYTQSLGFFDDFSKSNYTLDTNLWLPCGGASINRTAAVNPPTRNTVVMDNYDAFGKPYSTAFISTGGCDTLTSRTISGFQLLNKRLKDSLFLSFFWQAGGLQPQSEPDANDSLVLQFRRFVDTAWVWETVWSTTGVDSTNPFQYQIVHLDSVYLPKFTFRFINYGSRTGTSFDTWNLDYVYLYFRRDVTINPGGVQDLYFRGYATNLLKDYVSMPYKQVALSTANPFNDSVFAYVGDFRRAANIFDIPLGLNFQVNNVNSGTNLLNKDSNYIKSPKVDFRAFIGGSMLQINNTTPLKDYLTAYGSPTAIETRFTITSTGNDNRTQRNDTVSTLTNFANYYAYDDGSAELSRSVGGNNAWFVHKFNLDVPDTLTHVAIYFPKTYQNTRSGDTTGSTVQFRIVVLRKANPGTRIDLTSTPNDIIRRQDVEVGFDSLGANSGFQVYKLNYPVSLGAGPVYVGYQQGVGIENTLQVGLDLNNGTGGKSYYNWNGLWVADTGNWALMVRPWFGKKPYIPVGNSELVQKKAHSLYPNPSDGNFNIGGNISQLLITEPGGKRVFESNFSNSEPVRTVEARHLASGIYFVRLTDVNGFVSTQKWVKW